jgi:Uma2 family endonuclease
MSLAERSPDPEPPLKRKRWTAAEVEHLRQGGFFEDGPKYELLDGELVEMAPQGPLHARLQTKLLNWIVRRLPEDVMAAAASPIRLAEDQEPEPDIYLFPAMMDVNDVRGADAFLVVEVADSSLRRDRGRKADIYETEGVPLYWVVDGPNQRTWIHRRQEDGFYGRAVPVPFLEPLDVPFVDEPLVVADLLN